MDRYIADQPILITVPTTSGEVPDVADVTLITYAVTQVAPDTAAITDDSFNPNTESASFLLDLTDNPVTQPSIYQLTYTLSTSAQDYTYTTNFIVTPGDLIVGTNTYQTYVSAIMVAEGLAGVDSFKEATKTEQMTALNHAYVVLNTLTYVDKFDEYYDLGQLTSAELAELETGFQQALKIAQVIEANEMLDPNSVHNKRQDGLMSETIGESSMMFKPGNINNYPITRRSLMFLRNYILIRAKLERG